MTAPLKRAGMIDMESNTTLVQRFPAHEAVPAGKQGPYPAVILLHDLYGLDEHVRGAANRLAREGFYTLAPNLYASPFSVAAGAPDWMSASLRKAGGAEWPGNPVATSFTRSQREAARDEAESLSPVRWRRVVQAAVGYLSVGSEADPSSTGLLGFGLGARIAFESACLWPESIRAAACYCPRALAASDRRRPGERMPLLDFEKLRAPILFLFGEQDPEVREGERDAVQAVLRAGRKAFEIEAYREAGSDFYDEASDGYRISAAKAAWRRTLDFFNAHLRARPRF